MDKQKFLAVVFEGFETLDLFGPVEIIGMSPERYSLEFCSTSGGLVTSTQNVEIDTQPLALCEQVAEEPFILFVPGGMGTRKKVDDVAFIQNLKQLALRAQYVLTVCTGSALLAKTGLLDERNATSNKRAFDWVVSVAPAVLWQGRARWVKDGKFYTSSGVSAGMDMTLGFIEDTQGTVAANDIAQSIEYIRNKNSTDDPFAV